MSSPSPETQSQRWLKYGGNVVLSSVVVVLLAAGLVYIAQRNPKRIDTTVSGIYSLKPQTKAVLGDLKGDVRIVSLYPNPETAGKSGDALKEAEEERRYAGVVADLLQEYSKASPKVKIDFIDPGRESDKLDALVQEVTQKYGEELKPYKDFFAGFPKFVEDFKAFAEAQAKAVGGLSFEQVQDQELAQTLIIAQTTVTGLPERLKEASENISKFVSRKVPDYRGAADRVVQELQILDLLLGRKAPESAPGGTEVRKVLELLRQPPGGM